MTRWQRSRMMTVVAVVMAALATASRAEAQAPATPAATGAGSNVRLDTPQARVFVATLQPHVPARATQGHATHRVLVYLDDGVMTRQEGAGEKQTISFKRGDVRWRPASGAYVSEVTGNRPVRILEVDLKGPASGVDTKTDLDPVKVDAQHYRVMFENEFVRVLHVQYGPREKGALHEHKLNRVVVYLNDQGQMKADDVRMAGPSKHMEENANDTMAERIAVEIK